jgi:hypothetical protein
MSILNLRGDVGMIFIFQYLQGVKDYLRGYHRNRVELTSQYGHIFDGQSPRVLREKMYLIAFTVSD